MNGVLPSRRRRIDSSVCGSRPCYKARDQSAMSGKVQKRMRGFRRTMMSTTRIAMLHSEDPR
jgi:hypothetical protein